MRQKYIAICYAGSETNNDCASEVQQQITRPDYTTAAYENTQRVICKSAECSGLFLLLLAVIHPSLCAAICPPCLRVPNLDSPHRTCWCSPFISRRPSPFCSMWWQLQSDLQFLSNVAKHLQNYAVLKPRRASSTSVVIVIPTELSWLHLQSCFKWDV
jgi:hypothetical protein